MTYRYRKHEPGSRYAPATPPMRVFRRGYIGGLLCGMLGSLFYVEPAA